jgi:sugar transferase (PEP-CTERM/EpsH1 system associated)
MKILFLTPQLPYPPMQGATLRNFYLIRETAKRHEVSLLTFTQTGDAPIADSPLQQLCRELMAIPAPMPRPLWQRAWSSLASPSPDMALRLASKLFSHALLDWTLREHFDVIQVEGIELAAYGIMLNFFWQFARQTTQRKPQASCLVFDDHNAEYVLQRSAFQADARQITRWHGALYSLVQWRKLIGYERRALGAHAATIAVSEADQRALQPLAPDKKIVVVSNGIDTQEYTLAIASRQTAPLAMTTTCDLVFTGKMDYRPNIDAALWFADEIFPLVRARAPQAQFVVVGQQPHPRVQALAQRDGIVLTGRVDDVRPYIVRAAVYVSPLRMGGGTRFKALQAMALGAPLVSTTLGCEGLAVQNEREALLADTPLDFANAIVRLLNDAPLRRQLRAQARKLVVEQYDWSRITPRLEELYAELCAQQTVFSKQ